MKRILAKFSGIKTQSRIFSLGLCTAGILSVIVFQNCTKVQFDTDFSSLVAASSANVVVVNGGRPSRLKIMPVEFDLGSAESGMALKFTAMKLSLNEADLDKIEWQPYAKKTMIDLGSEYATDGTKDGPKTLYVQLKITDSPTPLKLTGVLTLDTTKPRLTALNINNGAIRTTLNYSQLQVSSTDTYSRISQYCFKTTSVQPTEDADCWTPVNLLGGELNNPSRLIAAPFLFGFTKGRYTIYAFAQDEAGNISTLSSSGDGTDSIDRKSIQYDPPIPPVLIDVMATNVSAPNYPPTLPQLTSSPNHELYIKWNVASAPGGLGSSPMELYYTTDEKNYILIAKDVRNGSNLGCALDVHSSGCYVWNAAADTNKYFRIRVGVKDLNGQLTFASTLPLNTASFNVLAGNTDPGLNGSAVSAIFYNQMPYNQFITDSQSFVVTTLGKIIFRDISRGILMIDPQDGIQKVLIPLAAKMIDGPIGAATLVSSAAKIALDYKDRVVIADANAIRLLDLKTNLVSTFIGGGNSLADGASASEFKYSLVSASGPIYPLPNGDLVFKTASDQASPSAGANIRLYKASENRIHTLSPGGQGVYQDASWSLTDSTHILNNFVISFNPASSQLMSVIANLVVPVVGGRIDVYATLNPASGNSVEARDQMPRAFTNGYDSDQYFTDRVGNLFAFSRLEASIKKLDPKTQSWLKVLGTGINGQCPDGTQASACAVDLQSVFVGLQNQIYFADRGRIRTITDRNEVISIIGQSFSFGDGGLATSARFGQINYIEQDSNHNIIVLDNSEVRYRQFARLGPIRTIAGIGTSGESSESDLAVNQPFVPGYWGAQASFTINQTNGNIYHLGNMLNRATGKWQKIFSTAGSSNFENSDGLKASQIAPGYAFVNMGFGGGKLLMASHNWSYNNGGYHYGAFLKLYDSAKDYEQSNLAGSHRPSNDGYEADGTPLTDVQVPMAFNQSNSKAFYDAANNRWLTLKTYDNSIKILKEGGGESMKTLVTLPRGIVAFTYVVNAQSQPVVYYCGSGRIFKYNLVTKAETALSWPSDTMSCRGNSVLWNASTGSVVFPFEQNALHAVAEIFDTP